MATVKNLFPFTILGLDPGTNNLAFSVLQVTGVRSKKMVGRILEHGMINSTMRTLIDPARLHTERTMFKECVRTLLEAYPVDAIIAERYMQRPGMGGTAIESINMMLGVLLEMEYPTKIIPASQWKRAVAASGVILTDLYATVAPKKITPHQTDSACISVWGAGFFLKIPHEFSVVHRTLVKAPTRSLGETTKIKKKPKKRRAPAKRSKK